MTEPLTEAQAAVMDYNRKQYNVKFKTFAIDRAISITQPLFTASPQETSAKRVIAEAEALCEWICASPKEFALPTRDEAEYQYADLKAQGEIQ